MEFYVYGTTNKFLTITGNNINDKDIEELGQQLKEVLEEFMVRPAAENLNKNIPAPVQPKCRPGRVAYRWQSV